MRYIRGSFGKRIRAIRARILTAQVIRDLLLNSWFFDNGHVRPSTGFRGGNGIGPR
jgi:hypothetical protein